jgi:uncharacterized protein YecT (DUF1311 family)
MTHILIPTLRNCALSLCLALAPFVTHAIDNPEAPDRVAAFEQRAKPFEDNFSNHAGGGNFEIVQAGAAYAEFLDQELNQAYQLLLKKLEPSEREQLKKAQRAWRAFYKAETAFIAANWVPKNFGSSYVLSKHGYRHSLLKDRVLNLLSYLREYA